MAKIFTRPFRARYSEIGYNGYVDPTHILRCLVETASDWGASNQLGIEDSERIGLAWVIRETEVEFFRPLAFNQAFEITIWLEEWRRVRGKRNFVARLQESGDLLARGAQQVVSLDAVTLRPVAPPQEFMQRFGLDDPEVFPSNPFPKSAPADVEPYRQARSVEWRDLDIMQHVNNAVYLEFAMEAMTRYLALPEESAGGLAPRPGVWLESARLKYLAPALWSDTLDLEFYPLPTGAPSGAAFLSIENRSRGGTACQAVLKWRAEP